jgi:hypothetical protein
MRCSNIPPNFIVAPLNLSTHLVHTDSKTFTFLLRLTAHLRSFKNKKFAWRLLNRVRSICGLLVENFIKNRKNVREYYIETRHYCRNTLVRQNVFDVWFRIVWFLQLATNANHQRDLFQRKFFSLFRAQCDQWRTSKRKRPVGLLVCTLSNEFCTKQLSLTLNVQQNMPEE